MIDANVKRQKRRKKRNGLYIVAVAVIMAAAVAVAMSMFFLISDITVKGNELYTADEVITASGIEQGKSIFFIDSGKIEENMTKRLAYVEKVTVSTTLPGSVIIEVSESYPVAWVRGGGSYWIIDKNGKLLERLDAKPTSGNLFEIKGIEPLQPVEGTYAVVSVENDAKLKSMRKLLNLLLELEMQGYVKNLDLRETTNITFEYAGRFKVNLGRIDDAADKLVLLKGVMKQLERDDRGTLDLSQKGKAHFLPD